MKERSIIHVDMDAFYAAVEQRDNPELKGKPVIIGGPDPTKRGVVATASYEARQFGVHSAMPLREAYKRCPHGVYLPVNMHKYQQASKHIFNIFQKFTPLVENISLDEAFLDVTGSRSLFGSSKSIAREIIDQIDKEVNLAASIGISYNKFLAKLASDLDKPKGFVVVSADNFYEVVHPLPVKRVWGVGKKMEQQLRAVGLKTIGDIASASLFSLKQQFGLAGEHIYALSHGIDNRPVIPNREAKSIGRETTFSVDISDRDVLYATLMQLVEDVSFRLRNSNCWCQCVTVKIRYACFNTYNRQTTLSQQINLETEIYSEARELFDSFYDGQPVRLIGVTLSHLKAEKEKQVELFGWENEKKQALAEAADRLRTKYGKPLVVRARGIKKD